MAPRHVAAYALLALTLARLAVAALAPLSPDEAYYWVWSRALAAGYPDHPPMVALWIRAGCLLAGQTPLGVRLLAPLAAAAGSLLLARTAEDLLPGRHAGIAAAALLNATLLFGIGAVTMTPDTPLLFFWVAAMWAAGRLLTTGRPGWWLVAGAAAGLALDSKYTAALLPVGVLLWLVAVPRLRPWLARPWPWLAAALALALFSPVIVWNAGHGWVSLLRQGGRTGAWQPARTVQFLTELAAGQIGLATPILAVLFASGVVAAIRRAGHGEPGPALLAGLVVPAGLVFAEHALGDRVQANWPSVMYPALAIAAASLGGRWVAWRRPGIALGLTLTAAVWVQAVAAPAALPMAVDPTLMRLGGWPGLAAQVAAAQARTGAAYVVSDNYGISAILAWTLPPRIPVMGADPRWSLFRLPDARAAIAGSPGLLVRSARRADPPDPADWATLTPVGQAVRARHGMVAERYILYRVTGRHHGRAGAVPVARLPSRRR